MASWQTAPVVGDSQQPQAPKAPAWAQAPAADDQMPASVNEPARTWLGKLLGVSRNTEAGLPLTIHQGMTFGYGDEINAYAAELGERLGFHPGYGYEEALAEQRKNIAEYKQANPGKALAANLAGAVPTMFAGGGGQLLRGGSLGSRMMGGAKLGGGYGAVTGFGESEGIEGRLQGAGSGLVTGAALGGATVPVAETLGKVAGAVSQPLKAYLMPTKVANEKLLEALSRDQGGKATLQAAGKTATKTLMSDADTMVADLGGENTQGLIKQAMRMPNAQREVFKTKLDARQARQVSRITDWFSKNLGSPEEFDVMGRMMAKKRGDEAAVNFATAYKQPPVSSAANAKKLQSILETPLGQDLVRRTQTALKNQRRPLSQVTTTEFVHRVKMQLDNMITGAKAKIPQTISDRQSQHVIDYRDLVWFKSDLMGTIDNKAFKHALATFRDESQLINAMERGARHFEAKSAGELRQLLSGMSPRERDLYIIGMAKKAVETVRRGNKMNDRVRRDFMDKATLDKIRLAIGSKRYHKLQRFLGIKGRQAETRRFLQGGSDTARNLMEMENSAQAAQNMTMLAKGIVEPSKIMEFLGRQHSRLTGMTPGVANALLKRAGQQANKARYSQTMGPRTQDDIDRAMAALAAGKPLNQIKSKYREIVKALIALEGYSAGSGQQP